MGKQHFLFGIAFTLLASTAVCAQSADETIQQAARRIAHESLMIDTHIDVPERLIEHWEDVTRATTHGDFDYPRAVHGGLDLIFMSIYTPSNLDASDANYQRAHILIDQVEAITARAPHLFEMVHSSKHAEKLLSKRKIGFALGMENGAALAGDIKRVQEFYDRGVRYVTLAHALSNKLADSSYDANRPSNGLSDYGKQVVREMNRLGMFVDVSHITDKAILDVLELTTAPVIATHSSARHFTPGWERNISDDLIKAVAKNGGVIHISFGSAFLTEKANKYGDQQKVARLAWLAKNGLAEDSPKAEEFNADYRKKHPYPYASISELADHFDHVIKLVGVDHVGLGSDYDGVGDSLPIGMKSVANYPDLIEELLRRGHSEADIKKILGGNLIRVWKQVEQVAKTQ